MYILNSQSLGTASSTPPVIPTGRSSPTMSNIDLMHFLQTQVLLYHILHDISARTEANDLANHISDMVGPEAWDLAEDLIEALLTGLRLDAEYDIAEVCQDVYSIACQYTAEPECASRLQRPLERLGTLYWELYTASEAALGRAPVPAFYPLSRLMGGPYSSAAEESEDRASGEENVDAGS
ncbi:unnamed protein product [Zymoseptoria tritici ST99CH_3D1]|nr:unnamed protein product [Zymoseptoria tritici ST99CH_3D1]